MQLPTQRSNGATALGQKLAVLEGHLNKTLYPVFRVRVLFPLLAAGPVVAKVVFDQGCTNRFLGFKLVIDIAQGHLGFLGHLRQSGLVKALEVNQLDSGLDQLSAFVGLRFGHHILSILI
jgi:hypothetical protein